MFKYSTYNMVNENDYVVLSGCLDVFENIPFLHKSNNINIGVSHSEHCVPQKNAFLSISYSYMNETVYEINGKTFSVKEGEFLIKGRGSATLNRAGVGGSVTYGLRVNPQFCRKYGLCDDMVCHIKSDDKMKDLFFDFIRKYDEYGYGNISTSAVLQFLMYINRHYKKYSAKLDDTRIFSDKQMEKIIKYINRNLFNKIRLSDMAALLDLNPKYFCHVFKNTCGYSPVAYANFLRCENAREILLTTDFTPKEVVEACGFRNMSHFKNMYRKLIGRDALADAATDPVVIKIK